VSPHRFGGQWTAAKLMALREYLQGYTTALKSKGFKLLYIDAFAGSGSYDPVSSNAASGQQRGSAHIALEVEGFHRYLFIERKPKHCRQLEQLLQAYPQRSCRVCEGDANEYLMRICREGDWRGSRAVLFLDPYGLQVPWSTLQAIAATKAIDVWYLFSLSGITRQLARSESRVDESKAASLDRTLGTTGWRQAFYSEPRMDDLFGHSTGNERHADSKAITEFVTQRLKTAFPAVTDPAILRLSRPGHPASGAPLYALYFMVSSPSPQAQAVALRIAKGVLTKLRREGSIS
jgi:three-Cys-motif partner protein